MEKKKKLTAPTSFIEFITEEIAKEKIAKGTMARKQVSLDAVIRFGSPEEYFSSSILLILSL